VESRVILNYAKADFAAQPVTGAQLVVFRVSRHCHEYKYVSPEQIFQNIFHTKDWTATQLVL
jgi:hypothetical protein